MKLLHRERERSEQSRNMLDSTHVPVIRVAINLIVNALYKSQHVQYHGLHPLLATCGLSHTSLYARQAMMKSAQET